LFWQRQDLARVVPLADFLVACRGDSHLVLLRDRDLEHLPVLILAVLILSVLIAQALARWELLWRWGFGNRSAILLS
jgi:hypothetical protein